MIVGTRGSKLALAPTNQVSKALSQISGEEVETEIIKTKGDKITNSQLYNMDSKGLFTKELDKVVLEEEVDFAVHSLKDVPTELDEDLEIVAIPLRESPNEVLISQYEWDDLSEGSSLGSSSLRREAFCNHYNKGFKLKPIRGNIETRIHKVLKGEVDATIMAEAGLKRLGLTQYIKTKFSTDYIYPAAGQGAIAIIARKDSNKKEVIQKLSDYVSFQEVLSEKSILEEVGVGCQWPLGAISLFENKELKLNSILLDKNGEILFKTSITSSIRDANQLGTSIGREMLNYI